MQLPPVVVNDDARRKGYDVSLLERLADSSLGSELSLLTTQYRSNRAISSWSSDYFYDGQVAAHSSVTDTLVQDLPGVQGGLLETTSPLLLVDTSGDNCVEESDALNDGGNDDSIANYGEAFVVEAVVKRLLSLGVSPSAVGVVSPYWAQVSVLRSLLWLDAVSRRTEVRTVDGYQGREKEVVVVSLVRSNAERAVGFLEETRRVNVAVTRAKRACVLVGDSKTLNSDPGLKSLIRHCRTHGRVVPASTFLRQ